MDALAGWVTTPGDWITLSLLAAAILSFPAEALWKKYRGPAGTRDLVPVKEVAEGVARAALDPGEGLSADAVAQAFLAVCKEAENGHLALKGRFNSRFAPIRDIDVGMIKLCIPDVDSCTLNVAAPGGGDRPALRPDGSPYGYRRLYVSGAAMLALWPDA